MPHLEKLVCPQCRNDDQDRFVAETKDAGQDPFSSNNRARRTRLVGWRCQVCKHVTPEE